MTTQELIDYYANLLILQYVGKPKAYATIQALAMLVVMDQLPVQVQDAFDLLGDDTAQGVQLDVIGKYVGVSRNGYGFDGAPISLDDSDFLVLIKIATIRNSGGSSLADIQNLLFSFFGTEILVFDYSNMHMSYLINSSLGSQDLIQLLVNEGLLPKPMGVQLATTVYAPVIDKFFGFRTYTVDTIRNSPFNSYSDYEMDRPWLSYGNSPDGPGAPFVFYNLMTTSGDILVTTGGDIITCVERA